MQGRRFLFRPQLLAARIVEIARMPFDRRRSYFGTLQPFRGFCATVTQQWH
jgi:hypothetical protein